MIILSPVTDSWSQLQCLNQRKGGNGHRYYLSRFMTKPTKWHVPPAKIQISLGIRPVWSESSLSAWIKLGSLATHWAHSKDPDQTGRMRSDWADVQADLTLWVHSHFDGFVMRRLISWSISTKVMLGLELAIPADLQPDTLLTALASPALLKW